jgi:hypothetical protein
MDACTRRSGGATNRRSDRDAALTNRRSSVKHARKHGRSAMRTLGVTLAAGAIGIGVLVAPAAAQPTGGPGEPTCQAEVISNAVKEGPGRRAVAEFFFGDYPRAVQDAERAVQDFCAS